MFDKIAALTARPRSADLAQIGSNRSNNEKNLIRIRAALTRGFTTRHLAMDKQDNSGKAAIKAAKKCGLIAAGIVIAILLAVHLTAPAGKRDSIMVCSVVACWDVKSP